MYRTTSAQSPAVESIVGIRRKVGRSIALVAVRGVLIRVLSFAGNVALARLLLPRDFGIVAFGSTVMFFISFWADAGMGGALIRERGAPDRSDLAAVVALQLYGMSAIVLIIGLVAAAQQGETMRVTAVMLTALPIAALQTPATIVLERDLAYGSLLLIEAAGSLVYYGWCVGTAAVAHWGLWSLASGVPIRAATTCAIAYIIVPTALTLPRYSWSRLRRILGFGIRFQAAGFTGLIRDQGLNVGIALVAGMPGLGIWSLANRLLQIPFLLFDTLWRISYPAMVRLLRAGAEPRAMLEKSVEIVGLGAGCLLVPLVGGGKPLVVGLFGLPWADASSILPLAALGLVVSAPISVATFGYLAAIDDTQALLRATSWNAVLWLVVTLPLLRFVGIVAVGFGFLVAAIAEGLVLAAAARRHTGAELIRGLRAPMAAALVAGAAGFILAQHVPVNVGGAAISGGLAEVLFACCVLAVCRKPAQRLLRIIQEMK